MKYLIFSIALSLFTISVQAQEGDKINNTIEGNWKIDHRLSAVSMDSPGESTDTNKELLDPNSKEISFKDGKFNISSSGTNGSFYFKGNSLYLNSIRYRCAYLDENKFSLVRVVSPELFLNYMLERKK